MTGMPVRVPVEWAQVGYGMPDCCVKHGARADLKRTVRFYTKPENYPLLFIGVLPFFMVWMATRKEAVAVAWPFCKACASERTLRTVSVLAVTIVAAAAALGIAIGVSAIADGEVNIYPGPIPLIFITWPAVGILFLGAWWTGWDSIAGGSLTTDGRAIEIAKPSPGFSGRFQQFSASVWNSYGRR